ncbi:Uncharacterized protein T4B_14155 [Trichinella pseudospiralis]|uniref:Arginine and glutamate-rich protein 1 n=2 Tax=Trichinella pseudospiralis TaxID=6337 RepID=A0A0V1FIJ3_TRIPS|nr:Uncharacterized protein T4E_11023 [Trichinella pseudospiralis]KRX87189.1 Uncharacterized protein T4E_10592 [Trichinella pseudospiralis]KRY72827.1 Uncharacterized protein T4A_8125 [Trichinella pseudospiralis]KRY85862.1 Uncharacterized protein T4D_6593 [Trichinella pseudospiralis]KRZ15615.1 Uncharacterized protein T4B_14155 [Trichinella pseudospiralis]
MRSRSRSRSRYRRHRDRRTRSRSGARSRRRHRDRSRESSYKRRRELSRSRNRSTKRAASCSSSDSSLSDGKISKYVREEKKSRRNELLMASQLKLTGTVPTVEMPAGLRNNSLDLTTNLQQVDSSNLMKATLFPLDESVIEKRAQQLLQARLADVDAEVASRLAAAKSDLEAQIRARISMELQEEISACQRREASFFSLELMTGICYANETRTIAKRMCIAESKQRCEELERQLQAKLQELEESKRKLDEERLLMLETKRMLETERQELKKEKDKIVREEQTIILGKGGSRPKLKFSLSKTK